MWTIEERETYTSIKNSLRTIASAMAESKQPNQATNEFEVATLHVNHPNEFDEQVWQMQTDFSQEQYKEWLKGAVEELRTIYESNGEKGDFFVLGDVINLLSILKVVKH